MAGIPFDDRDGVIWMNGKMVDWRKATTHVINHGLHYGSSVFEGIRVYGGNIFKLREHSERLIRSAELLDFKIPYNADQLDAATIEAVKQNNVQNGYIRPVAWCGSGEMGIAARNAGVNVAIAAWDWPSYFSAEARERGLKLTVSKWKRPSPETAPTASKAAGLYMICSMSKHAAQDAGFDDAIMYDWRGYVAEATGANLFFLMEGKLHTPTPDCFLDGITRRTVIELAKKRGIEVVERHIKPEELQHATEAFLTGTAAEVTPIASIGEYQYTVGDTTKQLMNDYTLLVNG